MMKLLQTLLIVAFVCILTTLVSAQPSPPRTKAPNIGVYFSADGYSVSGTVFSHEDREMVVSEILKYLKRPPLEVELNRDFTVSDLWPTWKADFKHSLAQAESRRSGLIVLGPNIVRSSDELIRLIVSAKIEATRDCSVETLVTPSKKATLIVLFATWCPPCQKQLSILNEVYEASAWDGFEIVALQADNETRVEVQKMADDLQFKFRIATPDRSIVNNMMAHSEFGGIPQSLLYSNGRIVEVFRGGSDAETARILAALKTANSGR